MACLITFDIDSGFISQKIFRNSLLGDLFSIASHNSSLPSWLNSTSLKWDLGTVDDLDINILVRRSLSWAIILSIILLYVCAATKPWKNKTNILNLILWPFSNINLVLLTVFFEVSVENIFPVLDVSEKHNETHLVLEKR